MSKRAKKPVGVKQAAAISFAGTLTDDDVRKTWGGWSRRTEELNPTVRTAIALLALDDQKLAEACMKEPEAFLAVFNSVDEAATFYRGLAKILTSVKARLQVGLSRTVIDLKGRSA